MSFGRMSGEVVSFRPMGEISLDEKLRFLATTRNDNIHCIVVAEGKRDNLCASVILQEKKILFGEEALLMTDQLFKITRP